MKKLILCAVLLAGLSIVSCKSKASDEGTATETDTVVTETDTVMTTDTISETTDTIRTVPADSIPK
jgi:uncharacterized protein YcfL